MNDRSAKLRGFFTRCVAAIGEVQDPRIVEAFAAIPREPFVGPGPWSVLIPGHGYVETPDDDPAFLYQDLLVALDKAQGINIGQPSLHARCLDVLAVEAGASVLHVGAGSGYYTSIIARLVGPQGRVYAYEIDPGLSARAARNLASLPWVDLRATSGVAEGLPKVDIIYVSAGITHPSWVWLDALKPAGRLLFPLQAQGTLGGMLLVRRPPAGGQVWPARFVTRAGFIACAGPQHEATGRGLMAAFAGGSWELVRSLRIDDRPDTSCWFKGEGWWLSTMLPDGL